MDVDPETAVSMEYVEQLHGAIDRLRGERNTLRTENAALHRDFDFLQAESKFTIHSLREQLHRDTEPEHASTSTSLAALSSRFSHLEKTALVATIVAQHSETERELSVIRLDALVTSLEQAQSRAQEAERIARERQTTIQRIRSEDVEMRDCLATTEFKLSTSEKRISDLTSLVNRLQEELEQNNHDQAEIWNGSALREAQYKDVLRQHEEVQSERNSLALQVTHLEQDLRATKEELSAAESRYTELQAHQLATMSSNEATRALRKQIEELEQRINRRTEQIGVHQHDIKRLETNLKLQEDRIAEMTGELEVVETEKVAMVEDCRTTREERDQALRRCEQLEEGAEELEDWLAAMDSQRNSEIATLVGVVLETSAKRRQTSRGFIHALARRDSALQELTSRIDDTEQSAANALALAEQHSAAYHSTFAQLQDSQAQVLRARAESDTAAQDSNQVTVALATALSGLRGFQTLWNVSRGTEESLRAELAKVKEQLEQNLREFVALRTKHDALLHNQEEEKLAVRTLEQRYENLSQSFSSLQAEHDSKLAELSRAQEELRAHISDSTDRLQEESALREELDTAQRKFEREANDLRTELARTVAELEDARTQRASLESSHRQILDDLTAAKEDIEQSLSDALEKLKENNGAEDALKLLEERHSAEVEALREDLDNARHSLEGATKARDELAAEHASALQELEDQKQEASDVLQEKEDLETELESLRLHHAAELKSLTDRLQDATQEKADAERALSEFETRYNETIQQREELEDSLTKAKAALESLEVESRAEAARLARGSEEHLVELNAALEKQREAEAARSELESDVAAIRQRLHEVKEEMSKMQAEKDDAQTHATSLQADLQRALSLQRSHESRIHECERTINEQKQKLNVARADLALSEQTSKSAEMQLTLQRIKHKEQVESLHAQITSLQGSEKLEETILELQEKCDYLEKTLLEKNAEIEENDDRFIQNNKEKKKLNSKIESLTRKVKALQDKLSSGSQDSTPKATPLPPVPHSQPPLLTPATITERPATVVFQDPIPSTSRVRAETGPAALSGPRSSEAVRPVFRPRTPEARKPPPQQPLPPIPDMHMSMVHAEATESPQAQFSQSSSSSSLSIGKKRRAPDDFDDHDSVPVQYFSADSAPVGGQPGGKTPRSRRGPQVGFTPVRGVSARPLPTQATSPRRATADPQLAAALIADVTNSPRSKANVLKRGWLKVKPGLAQAPGRAPSSSRPAASNRAQNQMSS